jgi:transcription elongation factor Elf1
MPSLMQQMYPLFDPDLPWILTCIKCGHKVRKKLREAATTVSIKCELCGTPLYTSYLDNRAVWPQVEK